MVARRKSSGELSPLYTLNAVTMSYRARRDGVATTALRSVSFDIQRGERVAIVGPSGSGKTTLLQLLGGLDTPAAGEIWFRPAGDGQQPAIALHAIHEDARARIRRRFIGFVYQSFRLIETMSALDNVALPLMFDGMNVKERHNRARAMLARLRMERLASRMPYELSGGEQQRVAIARAVVMEPAVLLADEPTGSLDSEAAGSVIEVIGDLHAADRFTSVIVTHDRDLAARVGARTIELEDGRTTARKGTNHARS